MVLTGVQTGSKGDCGVLHNRQLAAQRHQVLTIEREFLSKRQVVDVLHTSNEQNTYRLQCLLQMQESFHLLAGTRHRRTGPVEETHKACIGLAQKIQGILVQAFHSLVGPPSSAVTRAEAMVAAAGPGLGFG